MPQASVAEAEPSAPFISPEVGLQPRLNEPPFAVIVGGVTSAVQVTKRDTVAELPQPSDAVNVLTCERAHPSLTTGASEEPGVIVAQALVAIAPPSAARISLATGLQPNGTVA